MSNPTDNASKHRSRVAQNAMLLLGGRFLAGFLSFAVVLLLPHYVSAADLGDYFAAVAVASLLGALVRLGMQDPLVRQFHLHPESTGEALGVALGLRLSLSVVVIAACGLFIRVNNYPTDLARYVWLLVGAEVVNGTARTYFAVFRARERMGYEAVTALTERVLVVGLGGALVALGVGGITLFCAGVLGGAVGQSVVAVRFAAIRFGVMRPSMSRVMWRKLSMLFLPYALVHLLMMVYLRIDTILLRQWSDLAPEVVAWYGIAHMWAMSATILAGTVMVAAYPRFARLGRDGASDDDRASFASLYVRSWKLMLVTGVPFAMVMSACANKVSRLFYSLDTYPPGTIDAALSVLAWAGGLLFLNAIVSCVLRATNQWRALIALVGATACINVAANVWAIPSHHHVGAAWTIVGSEAFYVVASAVYIGRRLARPIAVAAFARLVPAWAGLACALVLTRSVSLFIQIPLSLACYAALLVAFRGLTIKDLTLHRE